VSRCPDGIGGKTFFDLLAQSKTPAETLYKINKDYKLGWHKAAKLAQICVWAQVWAVSELSPVVLEQINIDSQPDIQTAVDAAIYEMKKRGEKPSIVFLPNGSLTVPVLEGAELPDGMMKVNTDIGLEDMLGVIEIVFEK
jgi:nickel-dependent lactate racemase